MNSQKLDSAIQSAVELFATQGFEGTTTQSISQRAKISSGTLFRYFESKDDLILQAYASCRMEMLTQARDGIDSRDDIDQILQRLWQNLWEWSIENTSKIKYMRMVESSHYADRELILELDRELLFFQLAVKGAQQAGRVIDADVDTVQGSLLGLLYLGIDLLQGTERDPQRVGEEVFHIATNGLMSRGGRQKRGV